MKQVLRMIFGKPYIMLTKDDGKVSVIPLKTNFEMTEIANQVGEANDDEG